MKNEFPYLIYSYVLATVSILIAFPRLRFVFAGD